MAYYYWSLVMPSLIVAVPVILLVLLIWKRTDRQDESGLVWKTAGYLLLTPFRFILNGLHLPVGVLLAWLFYRNAKQNKTYKRRVIFLGIVVYLIGFVPLHSMVQDWFYPRDQMNTYLTIDREESKQGFSILLHNPEGTIYWSYHEHDEEGRQLYEEMKQSTPANEYSYLPEGNEWRLLLYQDTENYREPFRRLEFLVHADNEVFWLTFQGQHYSFHASNKLKQLLQPRMEAQSN
ncbi:hypothetical protein D3P07_08750 [Paenibacillus sp. 1011MAR3C5]|uniref:hypothetical protein n=1 Tax=Paenibacillus sp. 1011MAR3C5 TaxID=1675787 RepID=UPI000E6D5761|nr:hypothetical protein [Paenibacillus sp. 1011MAR3C5]RJE90283.1 hypothetical protein D3P07_08750 [Paenibacillus sp. 1011MAR3C5]